LVREKLATRSHKLLFDFFVLKPIERGARNHQQVTIGRDKALMLAKNFAHATFGMIAFYRYANSRGRGNHAHTRPLNRDWKNNLIGGDLSRTPIPPKRKRSTVLATPFLARLAKITLPSQMLLGTETHGAKRNTGVLNQEPESNHRQPLAAFTTAGRENFTATTGGLASAVADFTGALFAMWTKCRLHGCKSKKG